MKTILLITLTLLVLSSVSFSAFCNNKTSEIRTEQSAKCKIQEISQVKIKSSKSGIRLLVCVGILLFAFIFWIIASELIVKFVSFEEKI